MDSRLYWMRPAQAAAQGVLSADDGVPAEHGVGFVEHVHGAALALGAAGDLAVHLRHAVVGVHPAGQGVAVVTVGGDDGIVVVGGADGADGGGFLADVDVAEAADLGLLVGLHGAFLEAADEHHVAKKLEQLVVGEVRHGVGGLVGIDGGGVVVAVRGVLGLGRFVGGGAHLTGSQGVGGQIKKAGQVGEGGKNYMEGGTRGAVRRCGDVRIGRAGWGSDDPSAGFAV